MSHAAWFLDQGVPVFPLKDRSKEPACRWAKFSATREQAERFKNYGVRLGTLAAVDPDSREAIRWCEQHLPDSPFIPV